MKKQLNSLVTIISSNTATALDVTPDTSSLSILLNDIQISSSTYSVAYAFDVSYINKEFAVTTGGSYTVGKNVGAPFLFNSAPVQAVCCTKCGTPA
jgi:hypothetical protein